MNFFKHQQKAIRNTTWLIALFILATCCIVVAVYFLTLGVLAYFESKVVRASLAQWTWWQPTVLAYVALATLLVIGGGSFYKILSLRSGGGVVAAALGGRPLDQDTQDPDERKLLNVVEEMAIASGLPMPQVYVLDAEKGINAFAAGFTPNDAAIGVTLGCMRLLRRDELQGVIAHEFSHILHGDMRMNIRLIGVIHGILVIGLIGTGILRSASRVRPRGSSRDGKGAVLLFVVGAALSVIGYVGVIFGRLIKAAVCRQREFLADASAVDFTRNPDGMAGALKKIGGYALNSRILSSQAETHSHLFFGDWRMKTFRSTGPLSTHPPLIERICRIDPVFDGEFPRVEPLPAKGAKIPKEGAPKPSIPGMPGPEIVKADPNNIIRQIGAPTAAHLLYGAALIASIPLPLRRAARQTASAACMVLALLLDSDETQRGRQLAILKEKLKPILIKETIRLFESRQTLPPSARLPLLDLALPALRRLTLAQYRTFSSLVQRLVEVDKKITVFEFALQKLLTRRLKVAMEDPSRGAVRHHAFTPLRRDCVTILSVLAQAGHTERADVLRAFAAAAKKLPKSPTPVEVPLPPEKCTFKVLGEALDRLALASPPLKQRLVDAFAHCVLVDGQVTIEEAELLRAVTAALDCPLPPFLPAARTA